MNHAFNAEAGPSKWNNSYLIRSLDNDEEGGDLHWNDRSKGSKPFRRLPLKQEHCLCERLPNTAFIQREAEQLAPRAIIKQLKHLDDFEDLSTSDNDDDDRSTVKEDDESDTAAAAAAAAPPPTSPGTSPTGSVRSSFLASMKKAFPSTPKRMGSGTGGGGWKEPQPWQVLKAVESKDIMYLMEVRDRAFHLLLRRTGDVTPLLHAMRIGSSHKDVAILLVGAMSRFVNHLEDEDMDKPKTKVLLKALRTNLKLAIDNSLASYDQSDLIASFLQTLIMSEGDRWLSNQIFQISLALRAGTEGKPVTTAGEAVRHFATRELGKAKAIAALDDYVANATADLVMMAAWSMAQELIPNSESIPLYYFARDDRTYRAFCTRLAENKSDVNRKLSRRLRWQMRVLETALEGKRETMRKKVDVVRSELDEGDGV